MNKPLTVIPKLLVLGLVLLLSCMMFGQERFGDISGTVVDASGAVVPDATVVITSVDTNRTLTVKSRGDGTFVQSDVEPGRYRIRVEKKGFATLEMPNIVVLVGKSANVKAEMKVGSEAETIEVSGAAPLIDTTSTMIAHSVTAEEIASLPKGRNFEGIAIFSPSVNTGFTEGGFQINGASGAENQYYVDGVSTNSVIDGSARQSSTFDYLQEVQVKTTGLDAEYGGALGGVVSAITKSGGNDYHGDVHFMYYGNKLNAAPTKRLAIDKSTPIPGPYPMAYFQDGKFKNDNYEFGGSLGGPIVKDKLWFYTAFSPKWISRDQQYNFSDGPGSMHRSASQMNWFSKVSWDPTSRIRTNFTYLYTPQYMTGSLFAYNSYGVNANSNTLQDAADVSQLGYMQPENSLTGQIDFTLTNTTLLSVKGGRYYLDYKDKGVTATRQWTWGASSIGIPGVPLDLQYESGRSTPSAGQIAHDLTTRTYIQADFSQMFNFIGQHNAKFGVGTTKNVNNVLNSWAGPDGGITLYWDTDCQDCINRGYTGTPRGAYGYYIVDDGGTIGTAGSNITHLYFQDSWKIHNRLTINAGLRTEKETIPSFRPDIQKYALQFSFGDKLAPRLGASFDLFGNGKVKISGGWGRYFDWTKFDLPRGTFGGDHWWTYYRTLDSPDVVPTISLSNMPGTNLMPFDHVDWRLPGFEYLDPNVKPMSSDAMNVGVEWELVKDMVFSGRYVRSKLNRTIEDMGVIINGSEQYFYGNPGEGQNTVGASCYQRLLGEDGKYHVVPTCDVPMPKAKRVYDAMELTLSRRFGSGWMFNASYVYSKLYGNYSGLQSTDEILPSTYGAAYAGNQSFFGQTYRPGGNANRYFDLDQAYFDAHGNEGPDGPLPTDRPHVFKFYGSKQFKFGTEIGAFFRATSGTPVSTVVWTTDSVGMYVDGRGNLGRTPIFSQTDLMVAHSFKVGEGKSLRLEMNMTNLFNQKTNVYTYQFYNRREDRGATGMGMVGVDLRPGFDWQNLLTTQAAARNCGDGETFVPCAVDFDPRYNQAAEFNPGFAARFTIKYTF